METVILSLYDHLGICWGYPENLYRQVSVILTIMYSMLLQIFLQALDLERRKLSGKSMDSISASIRQLGAMFIFVRSLQRRE